jgi:hypothetical protein
MTDCCLQARTEITDADRHDGIKVNILDLVTLLTMPTGRDSVSPPGFTRQNSMSERLPEACQRENCFAWSLHQGEASGRRCGGRTRLRLGR